jgi:carboxylesterase
MMSDMTFQEGTNPYFLPGGTVGCLMLHGFTTTPFNLRWLAETLHEQGCTVHGPRLAGHGTSAQALNHIRWQEWYLSALSGYMLLREHCEQIVIIGFSFGGALSCLLAANQPVDALILMAAPHKLDVPFRRLLPLLSKVVKTLPKTHLAPLEEDPLHQRVTAMQRQRGEAEVGVPGLRVWPLPAIVQLGKVLEQLPEAQARVTAPTLLMHGKQDATVPFEAMQAHFNAIASADKRMCPFEESGHDLSLGPEATAVRQTIATFIQEKVNP